MNNSISIKKIGAVIGLSLGAFALSAIAQTWSGPPGTPPNCPAGSAGCDAPLNVGTMDQSKIGLLALKNFAFKPTAANVPTGSVLISTDSNGTVAWGKPYYHTPVTVAPNEQNNRVKDAGGNIIYAHLCVISGTQMNSDNGYWTSVNINADAPDEKGRRSWTVDNDRQAAIVQCIDFF